MALSAQDDSIMEDLNNEEVTSPPHHVWNLLEDLIQEDSFYFRFTGEEHGSTGNPFIMPCGLVLQNVLEFLHISVPDYLPENGLEDLAFDITSYYQDTIRCRITTTIETNTNSNPRLIPVIVDFQSEYFFGQFVPGYMLLREDQQCMEDIIGSKLEIYHSMDQYVQKVSRVQARRAVASLRKIKMPNEEKEEKLCSICLEEFDADDDVSVTPCDHVFHHICVVKWLQKGHHTCPLCRYQMFKCYLSLT